MPVTTFKTVAGRVLAQNKGGVYTRLVHDPLGNVIATCDAAGVVSNNTTYWPYGEVRTETGTNPSSWGFVGLLGYLRDLVDLLYVRARYYRPKSAQWMTVDPLWPGQMAYGYVNGWPTNDVDPTGLSPSKGLLIAVIEGRICGVPLPDCSSLRGLFGACIAGLCAGKSAAELLLSLKKFFSDITWKLISDLLKTIKDKPKMSPEQCCADAQPFLDKCKNGKRQRGWLPRSVPELFVWLCCGSDQIPEIRRCEAFNWRHDDCMICCDQNYSEGSNDWGRCRNYCNSRIHNG
jgi:RHS repeat-associated protein